MGFIKCHRLHYYGNSKDLLQFFIQNHIQDSLLYDMYERSYELENFILDLIYHEL